VRASHPMPRGAGRLLLVPSQKPLSLENNKAPDSRRELIVLV